MKRVRSCWVVFGALSASIGCHEGGRALSALALTPADDQGPQIVWDLDAKPLPDIPFPNNVGTRPDPNSPTGRRVNVSQEAPTQHEEQLRGLVNELDGFGTYAPLWVKFDQRIDVAALHALQSDEDMTNDGVYLINLDPKSSEYGQAVELDFGPGPNDFGKTRFPLALESPGQYFLHDPRSQSSNLIFETVQEDDANGNGVLDLEEDGDQDGVLDRPNLWGEVLGDNYARLDAHRDILKPLYEEQGWDGDEAEQKIRQYHDLITCYELETETLTFQPVHPLNEKTLYAVVLTRKIVGEDNGSPIRSPFAWVHHLQQSDDLQGLTRDGVLEKLALDVGDIAFAWTFTTQSITGPMEALRAGLYGEGLFGGLSEAFPAEIATVLEVEYEDTPGVDNTHVLAVSRLIEALREPTVSKALDLDSDAGQAMLQDYEETMDYFVYFSVKSPALLENELGVFRADWNTGELAYDTEEIFVTCAVPKSFAGRTAPFPVTFYSHGYTSFRLEMLGFAASLGRFGLATCSYDAYGHGLPAQDIIVTVAQELLKDKGLDQLATLLFMGRDRDLNADGVTDPGGDFWTANTFHTRDVVRQTMLDGYQVIRVLRQFGQGTMNVDIDGNGQNEIAGDFNADGVADFGGEQGYTMFGQSLGGIMSAVMAPTEPMLKAAAPTSGGAGLGRIGLRSTQGGVVQAVFLPIMGPLIVGTPSESVSGRIDIVFDLLDVNKEEQIKIAKVPDPSIDSTPMVVGDRVRVTNLDNGEFDEVAIVRPDDYVPGLQSVTQTPTGIFRLAIPGDRLDRIKIELFHAGDGIPFRTIDTFEYHNETEFQGDSYRSGYSLRLLQEGFGFKRQTPSLRRMLGVAQMVMDPADPVNFAKLFSEPTFIRPEGAVPTNLLVVNTIGDMKVPIDTGVNMARAAGLLGDPGSQEAKDNDKRLLDSWTLEGVEHLLRFAVDGCRQDTRAVLFDADELSLGTDPNQGPHFSDINIHSSCDGSETQPVFCSSTCETEEALKVTRSYEHGQSGMRLPYLQQTGEHGFNVPDQSLDFDYNFFQINQIGWYFSTEGRELRDDACFASAETPCSFY
jgi:hypothetical protein